MKVYIVIRAGYYFISKDSERAFVDNVFASMESAMKYISDMSREYSNVHATEGPYVMKGDHCLYVYLNNFDYMGWHVIEKEVTV